MPADGRLIEINENLFCLEILFEAPGAQFAAKAGLVVTGPGGFDVSRLHVIDPDDSSAERLHDAERLVNIAGPNCGSEAISRVVGNANGVQFAFKRDDRGDGAENFFAGDSRAVVYVV